MMNASARLNEWGHDFAAQPITSLSRSYVAFTAAADLSTAQYLFRRIYLSGESIKEIASSSCPPCGDVPSRPPDLGITQRLATTLREAAYERRVTEIGRLAARYADHLQPPSAGFKA
jgi:hypothetical protein